MYELRHDRFGVYHAYTLSHVDAGHSFSVVPDRGGTLTSLCFQRHGRSIELLDAYASPAEIERYAWGKSAILLPFPNRLADGRYHFEGRDYVFPIHEAERNNTLHGFGEPLLMQVERAELEAEQGSLQLGYHYDGRRPYFPFPFHFQIRFALDGAAGRFEATVSLRNTGTANMPLGFGWHPYFAFKGGRADDFKLQFPPCEAVVVDERMIPTGERLAFEDFAQPAWLDERHFDTCFALRDVAGPGQAACLMQTPAWRLRCWQETGPDKLNFFQIFTPPQRQSLAWEPMSCNINAFQNGEGLVRLAPGQGWSARFGMDLLVD